MLCVTETKQPDEPCGTDEFQCVSGDQCLPLAYQCDQEIDCLDRSDEIGCSMYSSEYCLSKLIQNKVGHMLTVYFPIIGQWL